MNNTFIYYNRDTFTEKESFKFATDYTTTPFYAIHFYKALSFISEIVGDVVYLDWETINNDFELLEFILVGISLADFSVSTFVLSANPSLHEYLTWFIKFMWYQNSYGEVEGQDIIDTYKSKFVAIQLEIPRVKSLVNIVFV